MKRRGIKPTDPYDWERTYRSAEDSQTTGSLPRTTNEEIKTILKTQDYDDSYIPGIRPEGKITKTSARTEKSNLIEREEKTTPALFAQEEEGEALYSGRDLHIAGLSVKEDADEKDDAPRRAERKKEKTSVDTNNQENVEPDNRKRASDDVSCREKVRLGVEKRRATNVGVAIYTNRSPRFTFKFIL